MWTGAATGGPKKFQRGALSRTGQARGRPLFEIETYVRNDSRFFGDCLFSRFVPDVFSLDIFLSHSRKHTGVLRPLAAGLRAVGVNWGFDERVPYLGESIQAGTKGAPKHSCMRPLSASAQAFCWGLVRMESRDLRFCDWLIIDSASTPLFQLYEGAKSLWRKRLFRTSLNSPQQAVSTGPVTSHTPILVVQKTHVCKHKIKLACFATLPHPCNLSIREKLSTKPNTQ